MKTTPNMLPGFNLFSTLLGLIFMSGCDRAETNLFDVPENLKQATFAQQVEALLPEYLNQAGVTGAAIAIMEDGELTWVKGFGLANTELKEAVTADHIFNAASLSKLLTTWAIMHLVDEGEIDLTAPVNQYLQRWKLENGKGLAADVTIERLLSHTGGISMPSVPGFRLPMRLPGLVDTLSGNYQGSSYAAEGTPAEIVYTPGQGFHYSGGAFVILQLAIEDITGLAFDDYMKNVVFSPLGMNNSQFGWDEISSNQVATPYLASGGKEDIFRFSGLGGSALYTTARDLSRWMLAGVWANQSLREGIISEDALALMHGPIVETGIENFELNEMGLGHFIEMSADGNGYAVSHSGDNAGWAARVLFSPQDGDGFLVLTNDDNGGKLVKALSCLWASHQPGLRIREDCL